MNSNLSSITQKKQYLKSYRSTRCLIQILESEIFNFQSLSFESSYILHPVEGTDTYANYSLYRAQVDTLIFKFNLNVWKRFAIIRTLFSASKRLQIPSNRMCFV